MVNDQHPKILFFTIGGFFGSSFEVAWRDQALWYSSRPSSGELTREQLEVGPADWKNFWQALDQIGVWAWGGEYSKKSVMDGTSWALELKFRERRVEASGRNAYPPGGRGPEASPDFRRFLAALSKLLSGREIY